MVKHCIRAGTRKEVYRESGEWLFVDIGFAKKGNKSCGVAINCECPEVMTFGDLTRRVTKETSRRRGPLNLLIEAPLSVSFDKDNNPTCRKGIDPTGKDHRYFYEQAGIVTMVATIYLVRAILDKGVGREVRLFEGFASFKSSGKSDHKRDVKDLRAVVWEPAKYDDCIRCPEESSVRSAFEVMDLQDSCNLNLGVPPVIYTRTSWDRAKESLCP